MDKSNSHKEKEKLWGARIAQASEYTGSDREFCQTEGLSINSFQYWKRKLARKDEDQVGVPQPFIRVKVDDPAGVPQQNDIRLPDPRWVAEVILHLHRSMR